MFILLCCMSSSLFGLYIVIPIPCFYGFWHSASLHLHTFYGNVFYTCFTSFNIHCIHVCVDIVRKRRFGKCMCGATSAKKHFKTKGRCL